jgi:hypothetical protein
LVRRNPQCRGFAVCSANLSILPPSL